MCALIDVLANLENSLIGPAANSITGGRWSGETWIITVEEKRVCLTRNERDVHEDGFLPSLIFR